jgi:hypothetical protein
MQTVHVVTWYGMKVDDGVKNLFSYYHRSSLCPQKISGFVIRELIPLCGR